MTWDPRDKNEFVRLLKHNVGQITPTCSMGKYLKEAAQNTELRTYLEIGTWNGLGSTRCFVEGFQERNYTAHPYIFYSLECNKDKCSLAALRYKDVPGVHILNEVFLRDMPADIEEIFPELKTSNEFRYWNKVDFDNMSDKSLFLERPDLPEVFDLILLDGGEFTTWYEYLAIRDRCKILALDDTNVMKCKRIVEDLKARPEKWEILIEDTLERNGNVVARRRDLADKI